MRKGTRFRPDRPVGHYCHGFLGLHPYLGAAPQAITFRAYSPARRQGVTGARWRSGFGVDLLWMHRKKIYLWI